MNIRRKLSLIALVLGEILLITAFLLLGTNLATNILILNIVVASLVYALFFIDVLFPWIHLGKQQPIEVGSLGVRWFFTWIYAFAAIGVMLCANIFFSWFFVLQFVIQATLIFLLILGMIAVLSAADRVGEVPISENSIGSGISEMKQVMSNLKIQISTLPDLPENLVHRINSLNENLRYISPANTIEAREIENLFCQEANNILIVISDYKYNTTTIENHLKKMELLYQNRKSVYSI
ncbi:hypothetical protein [Capnocytophaga sp.]